MRRKARSAPPRRRLQELRGQPVEQRFLSGPRLVGLDVPGTEDQWVVNS